MDSLLGRRDAVVESLILPAVPASIYWLSQPVPGIGEAWDDRVKLLTLSCPMVDGLLPRECEIRRAQCKG